MVFIRRWKPLTRKHVDLDADLVASPVLNVPHPVRRCVGKIEIHWRNEAVFNKPTESASFHALSPPDALPR